MKILLAIVGTAVLILVAGLMAAPRLITGDYAEIRIDKIEFTPDGRFDIAYSGFCTSGHFIRGEHERKNRPTFVDGSISGQIGFGHPYELQHESRWSPIEVPNIENHLLVSAGETYRLKVNDPLVLFDLAPKEGRTHRGTLALVRQNSCLFSILK